jgi:hypothetical protein
LVLLLRGIMMSYRRIHGRFMNNEDKKTRCGFVHNFHEEYGSFLRRMMEPAVIRTRPRSFSMAIVTHDSYHFPIQSISNSNYHLRSRNLNI